MAETALARERRDHVEEKLGTLERLVPLDSTQGQRSFGASVTSPASDQGEITRAVLDGEHVEAGGGQKAFVFA